MSGCSHEMETRLKPGLLIGNWRPVPRIAGRLWSVIIVCPDCGREISLGPDHQVDDDGKLTPNIHCAYTDCRWIGDDLVFAGWPRRAQIAYGDYPNSDQVSD